MYKQAAPFVLLPYRAYPALHALLSPKGHRLEGYQRGRGYALGTASGLLGGLTTVPLLATDVAMMAPFTGSVAGGLAARGLMGKPSWKVKDKAEAQQQPKSKSESKPKPQTDDKPQDQPQAKSARALWRQARGRYKQAINFGDILRSDTVRYGGLGALVGGGIGGLTRLFDDDPDNTLLGNVLGGAAVGGTLGGTYGGLRDLAWWLRDRELADMKTPPPGAKPNKKTPTTLRKEVQHYYKDAPGGFDEAVRRAQRHMPAGEPLGLQPWDPAGVDKQTNVVMVDTRGLGNRYGGTVQGFAAPDRRTGEIPEVVVAALDHKITPQVKNVIEHEMTHFGLQPKGMTALESIARYNKEPFSRGNRFLRYATSPEEFKAFMAPVKREWVQHTGRHLDSVQDAEEALAWYLNRDRGRSLQERLRDAGSGAKETKHIIENMMRDPINRRRLIQQLLQVVMGRQTPEYQKVARHIAWARKLARCT